MGTNPTAAQRERTGMADGSYPVASREQAMNALRLRGRSKTYSAAQVVAHVRRRAQRMGWTDVVAACDDAMKSS